MGQHEITAVRARGYAKLNLILAVTGRRADGYHTLDTVMRTVSLWDTVTLRVEPDPGIRLKTDCGDLQANRKNTACRAAEDYLAAAGIRTGLELEIEKRIPFQAGMGGSSADAAAVLNGLQTLFSALSEEELLKLASSIGADVPFQLRGGLARCTGIGEIITPMQTCGEDHYLVLKPDFGLRTDEMFRKWDSLSEPPTPDTERFSARMQAGAWASAAALSENSLQAVAESPEVDSLRDALLREGACGAAMTGSGSAVFGWFESEASARGALSRLSLPVGCQSMLLRGADPVPPEILE